MVFTTDGDAERARRALLENGFDEQDVTHYTNDELTAEFQKSEEHASSPVQIGQEVAKIDEYLALAKEGSGFLVLHASDEEAAQSAVRIVRPCGLKFAEKYNRFTIEELE
jgi:hypothetical protein